jgi:hypothetical protein
MVQFYFLSIITLLLGGLVLSFEYLEQKFSGLTRLREALTNSSFQLILGILTFIFGILKLLSVTRGDIPVVGDLLPALCGLLVGFTLFLSYYKARSTVESETVEKIDTIVIKNKSIIGLFAIIVAILHFIMPSVLFL